MLTPAAARPSFARVLFVALLAFFALPAALFAQSTPPAPPSAADANSGARLTHDPAHPTHPYAFRWWGQTGVYYFVQQSEDLTTAWIDFPFATLGKNAVAGVDIATAAPALFLRLVSTADPGSALLISDFDGDRISNRDELLKTTDPFSNASEDGDAIPDDWERFWYGTTLLLPDSDFDRDGLTLAQEFALGFDPTSQNSTAPSIVTLAAERDDQLYVTFAHPFGSGVIHFTTDGSAPTAASPSFDLTATDNRTDLTLGFAALPTLPPSYDALDHGQVKGAATVSSREVAWSFGWQGALSAADFGQTVLAGNVRDFVTFPASNPWEITLPPAFYQVSLDLVYPAVGGPPIGFTLEGRTVDASALVASPVTAGLATFNGEVRVTDGALTLGRSSAQPGPVRITRLKVKFSRTTAHSTGQPPYSRDNLPVLTAGVSTVRAAVIFPNGNASPIATLTLNPGLGRGPAKEIYYGVVSVTLGVNWQLSTAVPSTFVAGYGYFSLGRGWLTTEGRMIPDPTYALPAEGAFLASVNFGTTWGARIEGLTYANPSLTAAVAQGKAVLFPLGARRISGADTLAPPDPATPSVPIYFGERPSKSSLTSKANSHSTSSSVFTGGRYVSLGRGWIIREIGAGIERFMPDHTVPSAEVYLGSVTWSNRLTVFASTVSAQLSANKFIHLGKGWIESWGDLAIDPKFVPDRSAPARELYVGTIVDGIFARPYLAAASTNLTDPYPVSRGWISSYDATFGSYRLIPDQSQPSRNLYLAKPTNLDFGVLTTAASGALADYGHGWATGYSPPQEGPVVAVGFIPDLTRPMAPIYYGWIAALNRQTYSYSRSGLLGSGTRVTTGRILATDRIEPTGQAENVYYAPIQLGALGTYLFAYSNEAQNPSTLKHNSDTGRGVIEAYDRVRMDISTPASPLFYGLVLSANFSFTAYSRNTAGFIGGNFIPVGAGHIVSQSAYGITAGDHGVRLLLTGSPTDLWYGHLSAALSIQYQLVFRTAASFSPPPPTPVTTAQYLHSAGGVTYFYAGRGKLLDAHNFTADTTLNPATIYRGGAMLAPHGQRPVHSPNSAALTFPQEPTNGWAYGHDAATKVLATGNQMTFTHPRDPLGDPDRDGLSTLAEVITHGTNPLSADSDQDLVPDAVEVALGRNPKVADPLEGDDDGDGVSNYEEYLNGTLPNDSDGDSDNDGFSDLIEIRTGSNPNSGGETPANLDPATMVTLNFTIGDYSGSHSERYRLEIVEMLPGGGERFVYRLAAQGYGIVVSGSSSLFRLGRRYEGRMHWEGSNQARPDIDWVFTVGSSSLPVHTFGPGERYQFTERSQSAGANTQGGFMVVRNPLDLLGEISSDRIGDPATFPNEGQGVQIDLLSAKLLLDGNRNGEIGAQETTTPERPFRFWSNDDDVDAPGSTPQADYINTVVDGADDLADLFPVFLDIKQLLGVLPHSTSIRYKLKQADGGLNFAYTSLTRATAFNYLTDTASTYGPNADQAAAVATTQQITAAGVELPAAFLTRIKDQDQGVILLELRGMTAAPLRLVVEKDGVEIAEVAVNIATGEIEWDSLYANNPAEDFKIPPHYLNYATKPLKWLEGWRYFSDGDGPSSTFHRTRINVKVKMAGAAGKSVKLKAFDVDDPTPADWDASPAVIDTNDTSGPAGGDNNTGSSLFAGTFSTSTTNTITTTLDGNGEATVEFITTQKPGANYRIAAVLSDASGQLDALQVTNATAPRYVAPDAKPVRGFAGVTSPTLTIWRKLHVEMDSMAAIPTQASHSQKNYATGVVVAEYTPGGPFVSLDLSGSLSDRERYKEPGARIEIDGVGTYSAFLEAVDSDTVKFYVSGGLPSSAVGRAYTIYDDDFEIVPLPLTSIANQIIDRLQAYYAPTFIEPRPAQNPDTVVGFVLNQGTPPTWATNVTWNDAQGTEDSPYFWQHLVTLGHQGPTSDDMDGDTNQYLGATLKDGIFGRYSAIFTEVIRDSDYMGKPRNTTAATQADFIDWVAMIVAHEIGHAPAANSENSDHAEGGIMIGQGNRAITDSFSAQSILRFRSAATWSQP